MQNRFIHANLYAQAIEHDGQLTLQLEGELHAQHVEPLRRFLAQLTLDTRGNVSIDVSELDFVSINGLGLLAWLARSLREQARTVGLVHPTRHVRAVLELTRLDRVLPIEDDAHSAEVAPTLAMAAA